MVIPQCTALHVISFDKDDNEIMDTAIGIESMKKVVRVMQDHLYAVAAQGKDDQP